MQIPSSFLRINLLCRFVSSLLYCDFLATQVAQPPVLQTVLAAAGPPNVQQRTKVLRDPPSFLRIPRPSSEVRFQSYLPLEDTEDLKRYQCTLEAELVRRRATFNETGRSTSEDGTSSRSAVLVPGSIEYSTGYCRTQVGISLGSWPLRSENSAISIASTTAPRKIDWLVEEEEEIRRRNKEARLTAEEKEEVKILGVPANYKAFVERGNVEGQKSIGARDQQGELAVDTGQELLSTEAALLDEFGADILHGVRAATSPKLHFDLLKHFRFSRKRNETALELGCANGFTTRILVRLFKQVICLEKRPGFTRRLIPNYPNLIKLNYDLYQEHWAYSLQGTPVHFVFIDALHDFSAVLFDLKAVLGKISCCIHTIGFHDFYFPGVMNAIEKTGLVKYFGKRWKHLGAGFPNSWRPSRNHHGRSLNLPDSMNEKSEQHQIEVHSSKHFLDHMLDPYSAQCPAEGFSDLSEGSSVGRPSSGVSSPVMEMKSLNQQQTTTRSSSSTYTPWVHRKHRPATYSPKFTFYPTHPEGLLVELKDKFVTSPGLVQAGLTDLDEVEKKFSTKWACNWLDQNNDGKFPDIDREAVQESSVRQSERDDQKLPSPIQDLLHYCPDKETFLKTTGKVEMVDPETNEIELVKRGNSDTSPDDPAPILLRDDVVYYYQKRSYAQNLPRPKATSTIDTMVHDLELKVAAKNRRVEEAQQVVLERKVRPYFKNQLKIDLLNHGVYAIQDLGWQMNKARYLHQHLYPQLPKNMRESLPHVFEGGEPGSVLRVFGFLQFLSNVKMSGSGRMHVCHACLA